MSRWWIAVPCVLFFAALVLVPGLGSFGLWEPHERQLADRLAPSAAAKPASTPAVAPVEPPRPADGCLRQAPKDAQARTLAARAPAWGRDAFGDSDSGRRLPFALLGILCVLATAGIAMRLANARAGVLTALVLLAMPLLVLQSRQLTSEIGTATGAALIVYGLLASASLERFIIGAVLPLAVVGARPRIAVVAACLDGAVGALAVIVGLMLGFSSGGALLGVLVPFGAFAIAGQLGVPTLVDFARWCRNRAIAIARLATPRWAIARERSPYRRPSGNSAALLAAAIAGVAVIALLYQIFALRDPVFGPGVAAQRTLLGKALVAPGCYSPALGATWRNDDDLRYIFDSSFEQIAYGTFPWGVLAPIAFASLLAGDGRNRRIGALALTWAACAWLATEMFQRKVGFTLWAGFPAVALGIGSWLDTAWTRTLRPRGAPHDTILVGVFAVVAIVVVGKDLQSFTVRLSSLLVGSDAIAYPAATDIGPLPIRVWVLVLGLYVGFGFALATIGCNDRPASRGVTERPTWRSIPIMLVSAVVAPLGLLVAALAPGNGAAQVRRNVAHLGLVIAAVGTTAIAAFWSFGWQPALAIHLSSKAMFDHVRTLAKPGDALIILGDVGDAARDYAPRTVPELAASREALVAALGRATRVFAIAPQTELCQLHRELGGKPYFVIDDRNARFLLLSNKIDGATDKNPLRTAIVHTEPRQIAKRPSSRITWDNRIELLGWDLPETVERGSKFTVTMYYKVLQPVGGAWKVLFHFDGPLRFNGDHEPIGGRCQTSTWQPGDYIIDRYTVVAGGGSYAPGGYDVWTGFFTGSTPNFKNMPVTEAPAGRRDDANRIKIATLKLE